MADVNKSFGIKCELTAKIRKILFKMYVKYGDNLPWNDRGVGAYE